MDTDVILSFTNCAEDQFTCSDGLCVNIEDRFEMDSHIRLFCLKIISFVDATVNLTAMT